MSKHTTPAAVAVAAIALSFGAAARADDSPASGSDQQGANASPSATPEQRVLQQAQKLGQQQPSSDPNADVNAGANTSAPSGAVNAGVNGPAGANASVGATAPNAGVNAGANANAPNINAGANANAPDGIDANANANGNATPNGSANPNGDQGDANAVGTTQTTAANYGQPGAEQTVPIHPNLTYLSIGGGVAAGAYIGSAIPGIFNSRSADRNLLIPVVGPWIDLASRDCGANPCSNEGLSATLLVASGLLQLGGLGVAAYSFFVPPENKARLREQAKPEVHVLPMSIGMGASAGLGAVGRF